MNRTQYALFLLTDGGAQSPHAVELETGYAEGSRENQFIVDEIACVQALYDEEKTDLAKVEAGAEQRQRDIDEVCEWLANPARSSFRLRKALGRLLK